MQPGAMAAATTMDCVPALPGRQAAHEGMFLNGDFFGGNFSGATDWIWSTGVPEACCIVERGNADAFFLISTFYLIKTTRLIIKTIEFRLTSSTMIPIKR